MALPKEPRQKMINIMYLVLTAILALNVSAEILEAFKTVDKSLQNSSANLANSSSVTFKSLQTKMADSKTAEQAKVWYPKAEAATNYAKALDAYLEKLKKDLKDAAGNKPTKDGKDDFKEDNLDASTRLFETKGEGKALAQKLQQFKTDMMSIDPKIAAEFSNNFPVNADGIVGKDGTKKDFTTSYFHMTPTVAALTMLSKFQNNVKNAENQIVNFCHSQVGAVEYVYDQFKTIIGTSSTYLMPGEEMEVTAGIGSFSKSAAPTITINGVSQAANADGVAVRKFPVSGSGSVNVTVTYTKPDGSKGSETKSIPYTVGQPSSATVSLDKMDVFYIGVENPITIGSPTGMEKTSVVGSGCTINGSGPKRTVTVSAPGTCTITVSPQGSTPYTHTYRIKKVPDPVFRVGPPKTRMLSVEFKGQGVCRADMGADFLYDVRFSVVSATVYFSGANFPNVVTGSISGNSLDPIKANIQRCGPGSSISFDNIKVSGPGGVRVIDPVTFALY